jgi:trimeric autotransporter adhesin
MTIKPFKTGIGAILAPLAFMYSCHDGMAQNYGSFEINSANSWPAYAYGQNSAAIGGNAYVSAGASNSMALGFDSSVTVANSVAIGDGAVANRGAQTYTDPFSGATVTSVGEVSFGSAAGGSQLTNLAPGSAPTDAATVGQVQSAVSSTLNQANAYADTLTSGILSSAQAYANNVGSLTLSSANTYADGVVSSALSAANTYTDRSSAATLSAAQSYATTLGSATLTSADDFTTSYANAVGAATLTSANAYMEVYTNAKMQYFATNSVLAPAQASGLEAISVGGGSVASAANAIAIGSKTQATGANAIAIGVNALATDSVAIGNTAQAASGGTSLGDFSTATGLQSLAAGYGATALVAGGVALGQNANVTQANSVAIGANSVAIRGAQSNYFDPISGTAQFSAGEVSVGSSGAERQITNVAAGSSPTDAANVGQVENAEINAVNLSEAFTNSTANTLISMFNNYGFNTSSSNGTNSIAIGVGATAAGNNSTALGNNSAATANNSVAIGAGSTALRGAQSNYKDPISGNTENSAGEVSVGSPGNERQITNVAAGSASTDAANVAQLQAAISDANGYTDAMVSKALRQSWSVAAAAAALSNLPQALDPGKSIVGIAFGSSRGTIGFAAGASYQNPEQDIIIKGSASFGSQSGMSGGMGVGIVLN